MQFIQMIHVLEVCSVYESFIWIALKKRSYRNKRFLFSSLGYKANMLKHVKNLDMNHTRLYTCIDI